MAVLEVYRITLLSNSILENMRDGGVLEVYRITLLSNSIIDAVDNGNSFRGLQNYTTLKLGL